MPGLSWCCTPRKRINPDGAWVVRALKASTLAVDSGAIGRCQSMVFQLTLGRYIAFSESQFLHLLNGTDASCSPLLNPCVNWVFYFLYADHWASVPLQIPERACPSPSQPVPRDCNQLALPARQIPTTFFISSHNLGHCPSAPVAPGRDP